MDSGGLEDRKPAEIQSAHTFSRVQAIGQEGQSSGCCFCPEKCLQSSEHVPRDGACMRVSRIGFSPQLITALRHRLISNSLMGSALLGASQVVLVVKNPPASAGGVTHVGSIPGSGRSPGGGQPTPVFLPGESHGQRILEGYSPRGLKESTERLSTHARTHFFHRLEFAQCLT